MSKSVLIMGGKPINIDITNILNNHDHICRINLNTKNKLPENKDIFYVNNHIYINMYKNKTDPNILKSNNYHYVNLEVLKDFHNIIKNNEYSEVIEQCESGKNSISNKILEELNCPYKFLKAPRCGYQAILYFLKKNYKITVMGFSFLDEKNVTSGVLKKVSNYHDTKSELKILHWLHKNNYIDATFCMLENNTLPLLNCNYIEPKINILLYFLKEYGIVLLRKYYKEEDILKLDNEYCNIFLKYKNKIEILDKENCSNDERIFYTERYSEYIKNIYSNNILFNKIASYYNPNKNKKTLINKLTYEDGKIKNSGAGWHRDNHNCQFKVIMYLSDVTNKNGCFQWITNSSKKFIGYPKPRTHSYNTRFHDRIIEEIINNYDKCNLIDVCGEKGTIILADTTYVHRGKIIEEGERKAMTQYFF